MANQVMYLGRITKAPEVRYTANQKVVATFTVAVNREYKNAEGKYDADFFPCVAWGKLAALIGNSVDKGNKILVMGKNQNRSYEAKDGSKRYITELIVERVEFIERKAMPASMENMGTDVTKEVPFDESVPF